MIDVEKLLVEEAKYEFFENLFNCSTTLCGCYYQKTLHSRKRLNCRIRGSFRDLTRRHVKNLYLIKQDMDFICNPCQFRGIGVKVFSETSPICFKIDFESLKFYEKTVYLAIKYNGRPKVTRKDYARQKMMLRRLRLE